MIDLDEFSWIAGTVILVNMLGPELLWPDDLPEQ
jgi:hypothetical protein